MQSAGGKKRQHAKGTSASRASRRLSSNGGGLDEEEFSSDLRGIQKKRPKLNHFVQGMVHRDPVLRGQNKVKKDLDVNNKKFLDSYPQISDTGTANSDRGDR